MKTAVLALLVLVPNTAQAFFQYESSELSLELTGNARVNQTIGQLAQIEGLGVLAPARDLAVTAAILRLMADLSWGERLALEVHVYQRVSGGPSLSLAGLADGFGTAEAGRTSALSWQPYQRGGTAAELAVDRAAVKLFLPSARIVIGRQPVNFATTNFFTPNDFFQPFSAQSFFRVYKAGVDAARLDLDVGALSQITVVGVMGYAQDDGARPSADASALVLRASTSLWDFEWSGMTGKLAGGWFGGIGIQGEVFEWLGVRMEGHIAAPTQEGADSRAELAIGLEHRFESSLFLQLEYFYNGSGKTQAAQYLAVFEDEWANQGAPYLGRHYLAVGAAYELTPLLNINSFALMNLNDRSYQVAGALAYSLLDDVDASLVVSVPVGEGLNASIAPDFSGVDIAWQSEFGTYPVAVSAELRAFF